MKYFYQLLSEVESSTKMGEIKKKIENKLSHVCGKKQHDIGDICRPRYPQWTLFLEVLKKVLANEEFIVVRPE